MKEMPLGGTASVCSQVLDAAVAEYHWLPQRPLMISRPSASRSPSRSPSLGRPAAPSRGQDPRARAGVLRTHERLLFAKDARSPVRSPYASVIPLPSPGSEVSWLDGSRMMPPLHILVITSSTLLPLLVVPVQQSTSLSFASSRFPRLVSLTSSSLLSSPGDGSTQDSPHEAGREGIDKNSPKSATDSSVSPRRRAAIRSASSVVLASLLLPTEGSTAIENPLNLKGTFWETGKLYEKSTDGPTILDADSDDLTSDLFRVLDESSDAIRSQELAFAIESGQYGKASRLLRGGIISESRLRVSANALMDLIPEEREEYVVSSSEAFRAFISRWDELDAEVEAASRQIRGEDPRMRILTTLGEADGSLVDFAKNVRRALEK